MGLIGPEWLLPLDRDAALLLEAVGEVELFVAGAVLVDQAGDLYVEAAILGDLDDFAFAPPADGLQAVAGLADAESGLGDGIEGETMAEFGLEIDHEVEGADVRLEVEDGVGEEDFVIEIDDVEADDEIGAHELVDEGVDAVLGIDAVLAGGRAVGDADGHAHLLLAIPAAGVIGGALGFQIEIDDVHVQVVAVMGLAGSWVMSSAARIRMPTAA